MIIHPNDSAVPTTDLKVQPAAETELATQNPPEETAVGRILFLLFLR